MKESQENSNEKAFLNGPCDVCRHVALCGW